jgi:cytochrome P450
MGAGDEREAMVDTPLSVPLESAEFYVGQPYDVLRRLREQADVYWCESGGFWTLLRHADVVRISKDAQRYSSAGAIMIDEAAHPERVEARGLDAGEYLLRTDPPRHLRLRRFVSKWFTPRSISALEGQIRDIARRQIAEIEPNKDFDVVEMLAQPVPIAVVATLLGVPRSDWQELKRLAAAQSAAHDAGSEDTFRAAAVARRDILDYFREQLRERREAPRDDLITKFAWGEIEGQPLSLETQLLFCLDFLVAGTETTDATISNALVTLAEHHEQRDAVVADPSLIPNAVEEILRYVSPVIAMARTALAQDVIGGERIAPGERIVLLYMSANRDEHVWDDADAFDVHRERASAHLAFGTGPHACIGAGLARLELRVVLEELLLHLPNLRLNGEVTRLRSTLINGISSLPMISR